MKIGIITQSLANNYGGILQNYALQSFLTSLGHTPITIDFKRPPINHFLYLYACVKTLIAYFIPSKRRPFPKRDINKRSIKVDRFVTEHICKTKQVDKYYTDLLDEYDLDAIIVGSDQVWRPKYNYFLEDMFLRFVYDIPITKIAYAASFGVDFWEYTPQQTSVCRMLAQRFDSISVRELSGVELCHTYLHVNACEMPDPTLLLSEREYEKLCMDIPCRKENILAAYLLDPQKEQLDFINKIAEQKKLKAMVFGADLNSSLTIEEWLAMFRDAKYIITDSFHGTAFSIIFNRPFISIANCHRGNTRFKNLLQKFDLTDHMIDSIANVINIPDEIDWDKVNEKRAFLREKAYRYLTSNLR